MQAERHFAADGVGASLEAVARDAGVGSATLYRHFPTRDALLAEVLERRASQIVAEIERIEAMSDSGDTLEAWLVAMEDYFGAYEGLPGPSRSAFLEEHSPLATTCVGFRGVNRSTVAPHRRTATRAVGSADGTFSWGRWRSAG